MSPQIHPVFPEGYEPKGRRDAAWWLLKGLEDLDKFSGPSRIVLNVCSSSVTGLLQMVTEEISEIEKAPAENIYEGYFNRQILNDLKRFRTLLDRAARQAASHYDLSGRPRPIGLRFGERIELHFNAEWMKLVAEEDEASGRRSDKSRA